MSVIADASRPILVTGATGYLGGRVVAALAGRGLALRLLCRRDPRAAPDGAEIARGDVRHRDSVDRAARGCRAIVHLAARVARGGRRSDFDDVNVEGLRNVLHAAAASRATVERVIYASSLFALGPSDRRGVAPEGLDVEALDVPSPELDHYQASKRVAALLAREAARAGAPLVTLYPGLLVGPGMLSEANLVTAMVRDHLAGRLVALPAGGRRSWSFVHVDDVAEAHALALERAPAGSSYVLGGENATLRAVFSMVEELTGRRGPSLSAPGLVLWGFGAGEEALELAFGRTPRQLTRGVARMLVRDWNLAPGRAAQELGWRPRPLRQALEETIAWLESEGHLPRGTLRAGSAQAAGAARGAP